MPSKSRVVSDHRKTEEIIQSYGHEVNSETLALFNGVLPERIIQTPSYDTGAQAVRARDELDLAAPRAIEDLETSPIDGLAPADISKSRDSKPGGLNTLETKHEASVVAALEPEPPITGLDAGTFITPELPPADLGAATKRAPLSDEDKAKAQAKAAEAKAQEEKRKAEAKKTGAA